MALLIFAPLGIQALAIFIDEFYFHRKRGLPKWERVGHPIDTFSVLACYLMILFFDSSPFHILIYFLLSIFSSLLVTKDEFVHHEHCGGGEQWLHSLLFVLHPISFLVAAFIWLLKTDLIIGAFFSNIDVNTLWLGLQIQTGMVAIFAFYQIIYWNLLWKKTA